MDSLLIIELPPFLLSYIDPMLEYRTLWVSLDQLLCRIGKDSVYHACLLTQSERLIKLWGKDYIVIRAILPTYGPVSEVVIGYRLRLPGRSPHGEVHLVQWKASEENGVPFLCIQEPL